MKIKILPLFPRKLAANNTIILLRGGYILQHPGLVLAVDKERENTLVPAYRIKKCRIPFLSISKILPGTKIHEVMPHTIVLSLSGTVTSKARNWFPLFSWK